MFQHHPYNVKGLILMGDIYINHDRDLSAAEACFLKIIEVQPDHVLARHNLCVVYVEQGDLAQAESCLVQVSQLAPDDARIQQNLRTVQSRLHAGSQVLLLIWLDLTLPHPTLGPWLKQLIDYNVNWLWSINQLF